VIVPDPNYRPNASRAVYVQGRIDQQMADRLTPQIIKLQAASRNPITVFIDSRGGDVAIGELILKLLNASNQDSAPPCQIITVVTHRASSAAADLLSAGDYAIAYPESVIFYHGVRQSLVDPVTVEYGSALTDSLRISNDQSAMVLARKTEWRFMFRFVTLQAQFPSKLNSLESGRSWLIRP
jgi:ATP-dependent protease ClpP protease subunit